MDKLALFEEERFYHIFNRTNNKEALFRSDENRRYFLRLLEKQLTGFVNVYAYAMLGNHFHLSISIKPFEEILSAIQNIEKDKQTKPMKSFLNNDLEELKIHNLISHQFSRIFNSYTQAFNKMYGRSGNLFHRPVKRVRYSSETDFGLNLYYIHHNARKHGLVKDFKIYPWHSYHELISDEHSFLDTKFVTEWFGGKEAFIEFHDQSILEKDFTSIYLE